MSQYQTLKTQIQENINQNGEGAIRGDILQTQLLDMINALGAGYQFMGVATPTNPGSAQTPDYKCFYLATTPGTYSNLGGLVVADGEVAILKYDSAWTKEVTGAASADQVNQLGQEIERLDGDFILIDGISGSSVQFDVNIKPGTYKETATWDSGNLVCSLYLWNGDTLLNDPSITAERILVIPENTTRAYIRLAGSNTATNVSIRMIDANGIVGNIEKLQKDKVDKVEGKGLSTNDFSNIDKALANSSILFAPQSDRKTGYFYETFAGKIVKTANDDSAYYDAIDLKKYAGCKLTIQILGYSSLSGRLMGFGVLDTNYTLTLYENTPSDVRGTTGIYIFTIPTSGYLYISHSKSANLLSLRIDNINNEVVYIDENGNDMNDGSSEHPLKSLNRAIMLSRNIIINQGNYNVTTIDLSTSPFNDIKISAAKDSRVQLFGFQKILTNDGTLVEGTTKVYSANIGTSFDLNRRWIFQFEIPDASTTISDNERTAYHKRRTYRCGCTALHKVASVEAVEASDGYAFYYNSGILYYSRPAAVNSTNCLFAGASANLFSNTNGRRVSASGLHIYGITVNIHGMNNAVWNDCMVFGATGGAGFSINDSKNIRLVRCEVARVDNNGSSVTGDGFNMHSTMSQVLALPYTTFEMIDCYSHDNYNDGYSDHEGCEGSIDGGLFEHNCVGGQGGGLTPSFGAHDIIKNVISQSNGLHGIIYAGDGEEGGYGLWGAMVLIGCLCRYNVNSGIIQFNAHAAAECVNCISINNGNYGFYGGNGVMRCTKCSADGNATENYVNTTNVLCV